MKKTLLRVSGVIAILLGLLPIPSLLYNTCGLAGIQDCADGPKWETALVLLLCLGILAGFVFLSRYLFRLSART